jgi:hypothetical protein
MEMGMSNNFLTLIVLVALIGTFVSAPAPEPLPRSLASRATPSDPAVSSPAIAAARAVEAHQPPIPLVRNVAALPATATSPDVGMPDAEKQAQDDLDRRAAKAAIEADGYKGVSVLGKGPDGAWRAKAYRGTTEVQLTVDGTGGVSAE